MYLSLSFCFCFLLCRELVQVIMATSGEVGLQNLPKQVQFQQAVGHGQKLLDNLVEILGKDRKPKINNDTFDNNHFIFAKFCLAQNALALYIQKISNVFLSYPIKFHLATPEIHFVNHWGGADPHVRKHQQSYLPLYCVLTLLSAVPVHPWKQLIYPIGQQGVTIWEHSISWTFICIRESNVAKSKYLILNAV